MKRAILLSLAMLCIALAAPLPAQEAVRPVKLVEVTTADTGTTRQFFGQVVARRTVDLAFQVGGQVAELPAIEGAQLPQGALIAQLDLEEFQLALEQAQLRYDQAERTLERLNNLQGSTVSQVSVDDAATEAGLARIAVRNAQKELEDATLSAPFDALVAGRNVQRFATVSPGTTIVRLHDMSELRIEINVPEILFQRAGENPDLEIYATFPFSDRQYPLEVREFNAETSAIGQTYTVTLATDLPDDLAVLPGSSATVITRLNEPSAGLVVPASALIAGPQDNVSAMIFTPAQADADTGTVTRQTVQVDVDQHGGFVVTGGLEPGMQIVAAGASALRDGQTVRRFTGFRD